MEAFSSPVLTAASIELLTVYVTLILLQFDKEHFTGFILIINKGVLVY